MREKTTTRPSVQAGRVNGSGRTGNILADLAAVALPVIGIWALLTVMALAKGVWW